MSYRPEENAEAFEERETLLFEATGPRSPYDFTGFAAFQLALAQWISGILRRRRARKERS